jgi:hypothetical protein
VKKLLILAVLVVSAAPSCLAQLTQEQKVSDFKALVALYDKNYGPYEWKKEVFAFDLLNIQPWLDEVRDTPNDLAFYDLCVKYVAGLNDSHDEFVLPSIYEAFLPLTADIYDGRVLIDFVDNDTLDPSQFTFTVGDELVSVDGISMATWIHVLGRYSVNGRGNRLSTQRLAVATTLDRYQGWYTFASKVQPGDFASLVVRNQSTGANKSFQVPWLTLFLPMLEEGHVPNPRGSAALQKSAIGKAAAVRNMKERAEMKTNPWHVYTGVGAAMAARSKTATALRGKASTAPTSVTPSRRLRQFSAVQPDHVLAGGLSPFGSFTPLFAPPPGFQLRLGAGPDDEFVSGTFPVGNKKIGFIRIPSFAPASEDNAVTQFLGEMLFFQHNTDGLVVDIMANGGGDGCYVNLLAQGLIPQTFQPLRLDIRATQQWLDEFETEVFLAEILGASQETVNTLVDILAQVQIAFNQNRGLTPPTDALGPASCFLTGGAKYPPATDANGNNIAYKKPVVVLTNNFTLSAAEFFGATLQDAKRVTVYGTRTDGGGGSVVAFDTTPYSEGSARVTLSLGVRNHNVSTPGFPTAPLLENIGVFPDVFADFQTRDNLLSGGQPFVQGFSNLIHKLIMQGHP